MREATLIGALHPVSITQGKRTFERVDHPLADKFRQGDPTLSWSGDERIQLYRDPRKLVWVLMRLEHDNVYRPICESPFDAGLNPASVNQIIRKLVAIDQRNGFDPFLYVVEHNTRKERADQDNFHARMEQTADKLAHAFKRDLGGHIL